MPRMQNEYSFSPDPGGGFFARLSYSGAVQGVWGRSKRRFCGTRQPAVYGVLVLTSARTLTGAAFSTNCRRQAHGGFLQGKARAAHERFEVESAQGIWPFRDRTRGSLGTVKTTSRACVFNVPARTCTGNYLGEATTLEVTAGTNRDRQDPDEVFCEAFAKRCYGLAGADVHTDEAGVSVRHVGELWDRAWSVGADVRLSRSDHLLVSPRLLDPEGRPFAENPSTERAHAVEEEGCCTGMKRKCTTCPQRGSRRPRWACGSVT